MQGGAPGHARAALRPDNQHRGIAVRTAGAAGPSSAGATSKGVEATGKVVPGPANAVEAITEDARKGKADLIVMGTRGLGRFKKLLVGSVSTGVISHAPCAVMIVR